MFKEKRNITSLSANDALSNRLKPPLSWGTFRFGLWYTEWEPLWKDVIETNPGKCKRNIPNLFLLRCSLFHKCHFTWGILRHTFSYSQAEITLIPSISWKGGSTPSSKCVASLIERCPMSKRICRITSASWTAHRTYGSNQDSFWFFLSSRGRLKHKWDVYESAVPLQRRSVLFYSK